MLRVAAGDERSDAALAELAAVASVVVAAVADQRVGSTARAADATAHGRHAVDERDHLRHVVSVTAGEGEGKRDPCLVDDQVVFGAQPSTVNRARTRRAAPFFACT